uniref:Transmembrane protein n=1 Tax=Anguilla anguilla TaxID=7936 RepID=A0A0E9SZM4_ANGAN
MKKEMTKNKRHENRQTVVLQTQTIVSNAGRLLDSHVTNSHVINRTPGPATLMKSVGFIFFFVIFLGHVTLT